MSDPTPPWVFFLDPHGDAIAEILKYDYALNTGAPVRVLDPEDDTHSFALNPLACRDVTSLRERIDTYTNKPHHNLLALRHFW
jgi:hypothetical protein